jgi:hypothetical protein
MANDGYVDALFREAGVSGIVPVGYDPGSIMRVGADGSLTPVSIPGSPPPSPPFGRSGRYVFRRAPLGFPTLTVAANASNTFVTQQVSRVYHPDRLLIIPAAPGLVIDSIRVGDEEQTVTPGAAVELYGVEALTDSKPDNFSPVQTGTTVTILIRNTTGAPIAVTMGMKGGVER